MGGDAGPLPLPGSGSRVVRYRVGSYSRRHRWQVAALTALIALVGGFVTIVAAGATRTLSAADRYEDVYGGEFDGIVEQVDGGPRDDEVRALRSVTSVVTVTFVFGVVTTGDEVVESLVFAGDYRAFGSQLLDGRTPRAPEEFLASEAFMERTGSSLGDRFTLVTVSQEQAFTTGFDTPPDEIAGPTVEARVVGTFAGPSDLQQTAAYAVFPPSMLGLGDVGIAASQHAVGLRPGAKLTDLRTELDELDSPESFAIDPARLVVADVRQAVDTRGRAIAVLALVLGLAAVATLGQLLSRTMRIEDGEAAALRSLGMGPRQLVLDPSARAVGPIVVGLVVAGPLAYVLSGRFPMGFTALVEPSPGVRFEWAHLWVPGATALGVAAWVVAAMASARRRRRVSRSAAVERVARAAPGVTVATGVRFAFTRAGRGGSVVAPLVGLASLTAVVVAAVTFGASLGRLIDDPERFGGFDVSAGQGGDAVPPEVVEVIAADPGVGLVVLAGNVVTTVDSLSIDLTGVEAERGSYEPSVLEGRAARVDDEVMLGRVTARNLGVGVGGHIDVRAPGGTVRMSVVGIGLVPSAEGGDGVGQGGLVTVDALRRLDPEVSVGFLLAEVRSGDGAETIERLKASLDGVVEVKPPDLPPVILNVARVRTVPYVVAALLAALVLVGLGHQLLTSARHRHRDLAVMRALGAGRRWTAVVVHWQATLWVVGLAVIAVPVGVVVGRVLYRAFADGIGASPGTAVPLGLLLIGVAGLVVLTNVVAMVPAGHVRRQLVARDLVEE